MGMTNSQGHRYDEEFGDIPITPLGLGGGQLEVNNGEIPTTSGHSSWVPEQLPLYQGSCKVLPLLSLAFFSGFCINKTHKQQNPKSYLGQDFLVLFQTGSQAIGSL